MVPKFGSKFAPWLSKEVGLKVGMQVKIITEPVSKIIKGKEIPLMCEVLYNDKPYTLSLNKTSYFEIAKKLGVDPTTWIDMSVEYEGLKDIKSPQGTVRGHIWHGVEEVIDLDKDTIPF